jgi:hypothetical protein
MTPCSFPTYGAGLRQFSFENDYINFPPTSHEKYSFEELFCYAYTLFLLCDGPKQEDSAKPRFTNRQLVLVTTGSGALTFSSTLP